MIQERVTEESSFPFFSKAELHHKIEDNPVLAEKKNKIPAVKESELR